MKKENLVTSYDEKHIAREIFVDDRIFLAKKKISLSKVKKLLYPELTKRGYKLGKGDFQWLEFTEDCPYKDAYRVNKTECGLCLFTFECRNGGESFLAVYAPYGSLFYVLSKNEYSVIGKVNKQQIQLNLGYLFEENEKAKEDEEIISKEVKLFARIAQVTWNYFGTPCLVLLSDLVISKSVYLHEKNAIDAYNRGFQLSEKKQEGKLFELAKVFNHKN